MKVSFVILTWNSAKYILRCLYSYSKAISEEGLKAEFIVVDNGSVDNTTSIIENEVFPNLPSACTGKLFKLKKNCGTTISRNMALKSAIGDYIVICDSDTEFKNGSWKQALIYLNNHKKAALLAPRLVFPTGRVQNSVKKFPTFIDKITKLGKIFFKISLGNSDFYNTFPWKNIRPVDTAISACWIFKKDILKTVGYLDEKIFYAPEDVDFCMRIWKAGKQVLYYPYLEIIHYTQQISHVKPFSMISIQHLLGLIYYYRKHGGWLVRKGFKF